jgi:putative ABC transport system permease protein
MKKSIKDYAIYFFTLMLGVCLFYVFNSIETQTTMLALSKDSRDTVKLLVQMINTISVFVAFVILKFKTIGLVAIISFVVVYVLFPVSRE